MGYRKGNNKRADQSTTGSLTRSKRNGPTNSLLLPTRPPTPPSLFTPTNYNTHVHLYIAVKIFRVDALEQFLFINKY